MMKFLSTIATFFLIYLVFRFFLRFVLRLIHQQKSPFERPTNRVGETQVIKKPMQKKLNDIEAEPIDYKEVDKNNKNL